MLLEGLYTIRWGSRLWRIPNAMTADGVMTLLRQSLQANDDGVPPGPTGTWWFGLTKVVDSPTLTLADVTANEPTTGGYARKSLTRDANGWPTELDISGKLGMRTALITWEITGNWDKPVTRPFMASVGAGSSGKLFSLGAPLENEIQPQLGEGPLQIHYEIFAY